MDKQFLISSFFMVGESGRRAVSGMLGLHTHKVLSDFISAFRDDLEHHGEWLEINGHEVSIDITLQEVEAACGIE